MTRLVLEQPRNCRQPEETSQDAFDDNHKIAGGRWLFKRYLFVWVGGQALLADCFFDHHHQNRSR